MLSSFQRLFKRPAPRRARSHSRPASAAAKRAHALEQFVVEEIELRGGPELAVTQEKRSVRLPWRAVRRVAGYVGLWLVLVLASVHARSLWPADETRLASIAWEMWAGGNLLVPYLNGDAHAQAPLFLWLVHAGWAAFGVTEWWMRLVPALFALGCLLLVGRLARRLWPDSRDVARFSPHLLIGTLAFAVYATLALVELLTAFFVLLAMWGLLMMWRARDMRAWLLLGVAQGLAMLAGGPWALVYILPVALAAPLWVRTAPRPRWRHWYADVGKATLLAAGMFGAWLGSTGDGIAYALGFFTITAPGPVLDLFASMRYAWWYLFLLPFVFLPWSLLPPVWLRLWHIRRRPLDAGFVFCLVWLFVPLALLSLFHIKQPQHLLPLIPAGTLMAAWLLMHEEFEAHNIEGIFAGMAIPAILTGSALAVIPKLPRVDFLPELLWGLSPLIGVGVILVGVALAFLPQRKLLRRVLDSAVGGVMLLAVIILGAGFQFNALYRVDDTAAYLGAAERQDRPIAVIGEYRGEYHFAGRLHKSVKVLQPAHAAGWAAAHPQGLIAGYASRWQPRVSHHARPVFETSHQGDVIRVWEARALLAQPSHLEQGRAPL